MLEQSSREFETLFLLRFTKELIRNAGASEVFELENILNEEPSFPISENLSEEIKTRVQEVIKKEPAEKKEIKEKEPVFDLFSKSSQFRKINPFESSARRRLSIPEPRLPMRFQYLKPIPRNVQIDLEKLNPLIKDPLVKSIECNGPDENIIVRGGMGIKPTTIILTNEEILQVIKKFSETAKIPIHEGVFRVAVGKLVLLATISEVIGTKFIIKKMIYNPEFN